MALYGVGLDVNVKRINSELRLYLGKNQGSISIRQLRRLFEFSDQNGNKVLKYDEFTKCLNQFGFFLKKVDYQALFKGYDKNNDGVINFIEFINGVLYDIVQQSFDLVDSDQDGFICYDELNNRFNAKSDQDFVNQKRSREDIVQEIFQDIDDDRDGKISREEFLRYYEDLRQNIEIKYYQSLNFPADVQFINLLKQQWGLTQVNQKKPIDEKLMKEVINTLRFKLIQKTSGTHEEFLLKQIFNEFDTNKNGTLTLDELYSMTVKLDVPVNKDFLQVLIGRFDRNQNGCIEYDEFVRFLLTDIYK